MKLRDKYGWPVTTIMGFHPITNLLRRLIHTNVRQTCKHRHLTTATITQRCVGSEVTQESSNETP